MRLVEVVLLFSTLTISTAFCLFSRQPFYPSCRPSATSSCQWLGRDDNTLEQKKSSSDDNTNSIELIASRGHSFAQVGEDIKTTLCPLQAKDIHLLLAQYRKAQNEGRYEEANSLLFQLKINGVEVDTEQQAWRADGRKIQEGDAAPTQNSIHSTIYKEEATEHASRTTQDRVRVAHLIQDRATALLQEDHHRVHYLSLELWKTYGVVVDDSNRTWSFQDESQEAGYTVECIVETNQENALCPPLLFPRTEGGNQAYSYQLSIHSLNLPNEATTRRIVNLIQKRAQKRAKAKFREADAIRTELWRTYYVGLNDRLQQWSVGGVFDDKATPIGDNG